MERYMALLKEWQKIAYDENMDKGKLQQFWQNYFLLEKGIYEKLLEKPEEAVTGTAALLDHYVDLYEHCNGYTGAI